MKTIGQMDKWLKSYIGKKRKNFYLHGACIFFAKDMLTEIGDDYYEQWELWSFHHRYKKLPLIVEDVKLPCLCDIGDMWHVIVKWNGWFWDASGKHRTIEEKHVHFNQCPSPHWLQTE